MLDTDELHELGLSQDTSEAQFAQVGTWEGHICVRQGGGRPSCVKERVRCPLAG